MSLWFDATVARGGFRVTARLEVAPGETLAVVGPNGAGKSSCLHAVAGLLGVERGTVRVGTTVLDDPAAGTWVPAEERGAGLVPQASLLFPHLSARDNVGYGMRARGTPVVEVRRRADELLEQVGLGGFGGRKPRDLSGGEAQRVALARALAVRPRMLLLDEPLSAVDASGRLELRQLLQRVLADFEGPALVVTHDPVDAFVLADRIAVLEQGRLVQEGSAAEIGSSPRTRYVADLVGLNFLRGSVHDSIMAVDGGGQLVVATTVEGRAVATVHPRAVSLFRERPSGSPRNVWQAIVARVEPALSGRRVLLGGPVPLVAEVTQSAVDELGIGPGATVWVALKATEVGVMPA